MNFKFSLNETGSIGLIQKPASEILTGVESDIESLALSLDMSEADSEFGKAVVEFGVESTQYIFATEADAAAAKNPGLLKRIKDQMAKMWKALKEYVLKACKWLKNLFKRKNKVLNQAENHVGVVHDVVKICEEEQAKTPDASNEELGKRITKRIQEEIGPVRGGGLEADDSITAINSRFANNGKYSIRIIAKAVLDQYLDKKYTANSNVAYVYRIPLLLPIANYSGTMKSYLEKAKKFLQMTKASSERTDSNANGAMSALINICNSGAGAVINLISLMELGSEDKAAASTIIASPKDVKDGLVQKAIDSMDKTGGLKLYRVEISVPGSWVNKDKRVDCIAAFRNSPAFVTCEIFYKLIIDTIEYFEYLYTKRLTDNEIDNILANIFTSGEVDIEYVNKLKNEYIIPFKTLIKKFTTYFNINKMRYAQSSTSADHMYSGGDKDKERDIEDKYSARSLNEK